jgi:hypothetical protein
MTLRPEPERPGHDAELRARADELEWASRLARGEVPQAEPLDPLPPGDRCHFVCPVRFGRRRADQVGHLMLTSGRLLFRGALDVSVAWGEVSEVRRNGPEIVISLQGSARVLRFSCQSLKDAAAGGAIAGHLARADAPSPPPHCHASM